MTRQLWEDSLNRAATAIREMGAEPILAVVPMPGVPPDASEWSWLHSCALGSGFLVIAVADLFAGLDAAELLTDLEDHNPNAEAHRLIGAALGAKLLEDVPQLTVVNHEEQSARAAAQTEWPARAAARKALSDWRKRWQVETHHQSQAQVERSASEPGLMRVSISKLPQAIGWHVKLRHAPVSVRQHDRYLLRFRLRAAAPRTVGIGVEQDVKPWGLLGLYVNRDVTSEWETFQEEFQATGTESTARVCFDLGTSDIEVEVDGVMLRNLSTGRDVMTLPPSPCP